MTAMFLNCTEAEYHADPCPVPSLSSSIARALISRSPAHAHAEHPRLGGVKRKASKAQERGTIEHLLLLGGSAKIAAIHHDSYRSNAAKAERDEAKRMGLTPVLAHELSELMEAAEGIKTNMKRAGVSFDGGLTEKPVMWHETPPCEEAVVCRAMFDHVNLDTGVILDLKTAEDCSPASISRSIAKWGYDIQAAAYTAALEAIAPGLAGKTRFVFVFAELEPPYSVVPVELSGEFKARGRSLWDRAVRNWGQCLRSGMWPSYAEGEVLTVEPPAWAMVEF